MLDVNLPDMSGLDIMEHLKKQGITTEVVVVTGNASMSLAVNVMRMGAYDFGCAAQCGALCDLSRMHLSGVTWPEPYPPSRRPWRRGRSAALSASRYPCRRSIGF
ncbi:MAG: response regulator [Nitratireductor sp.]